MSARTSSAWAMTTAPGTSNASALPSRFASEAQDDGVMPPGYMRCRTTSMGCIAPTRTHPCRRCLLRACSLVPRPPLLLPLPLPPLLLPLLLPLPLPLPLKRRQAQPRARVNAAAGRRLHPMSIRNSVSRRRPAGGAAEAREAARRAGGGGGGPAGDDRDVHMPASIAAGDARTPQPKSAGGGFSDHTVVLLYLPIRYIVSGACPRGVHFVLIQQ